MNFMEIPFFKPDITKEDKDVIDHALNSKILTDGNVLREFEKKFAKFVDAKYAIGVSNATSALHLSLKSLGIGKGDEVIVPDMTFVATGNSVFLAGATPVLADIDENNMNISIESILENITKKTKAIIPVHFAGKACKIQEIKKIAKQYNISIIEDCAHAIGTKIGKKHVGNFGSLGCFSFYPTKNITTIEGGMIITNSKKLKNFLIKARNHGISKSLIQRYSKGKPWDYDIKNPGYNYRLDEIRSTLGINQLKRIEKLNLKRKKAAEYYNKKLVGVGIKTPGGDRNQSHHLYIIKIKKEFRIKRDELYLRLLKKNISTSVHYKPLHKFTIFKNYAKKYGSLQNSSNAYEEILSLPFYPSITKKEQDIVIKNILNSNKIFN